MRVTISPADRPSWSTDISVGRHTIGRGIDCDIVVPDPRVSQLHAQLDVLSTGIWVTDLRSTNGTYISGDRIATPVWVSSPACITVGAVEVHLDTMNLPPDPTAVSQLRTEYLAPPRGPEPAPSPTASAADPTTPATNRLSDAGAVSGRDVRMKGHQVAGRDLIYQEGWKLRSKMRRSAKNCLRLGAVLALVGMGLMGYFILQFQGDLLEVWKSSERIPDQPDPPDPIFVALGVGLVFSGIVLFVVGLLIPRDKIMMPDGR